MLRRITTGRTSSLLLLLFLALAPALAQRTGPFEAIDRLRAEGRYAEAVKTGQAFLKQEWEPLVRSDILDSLASALKDEGRYPEAIKAALDCASLRKAHLTEESIGYALALNTLANVYWGAEDYEKAEAAFKRAILTLEAHGGPDEQVIIKANYAGLVGELGRYEDAVEPLKDVLEHFQRGGEKDRLYAAMVSRDLGEVYLKLKRYREAHSHLMKAVEYFNKHAPGHIENAYLWNVITDYWVELKDPEKAEEATLVCLSIVKGAAGEEHIKTGFAYQRAGDTYQALRKPEKALEHYEKSRTLLEAGLAKDDPSLIRLYRDLSDAYSQRLDLDKAQFYASKALVLAEQKHGPNHEVIVEVCRSLGYIYAALDDDGRAEELFLRAVAVARKVHGASDPETGLYIQDLGIFYESLGRSEEAFSKYMEAMGLYSQDVDEYRDNLVHLGLDLLEYYRGVGRLEDAKLLINSLEGLEFEDNPNLTVAVKSETAQVLFLMGQLKEAETELRAAVKLGSEVFGEEDWRVTDCQATLAKVLLLLGKKDKAVEAVAAAEVGRRKLIAGALRFAPEEQRMNLLYKLEPFDVLGTVGAAEPLLESVLSYKGLALDSIAIDAAVLENLDGAGRELRRKIESGKRRLSRLWISAGKDSAEAAELKRQIGDLESRFFRMAGKLLQVGADANKVKRAVPARAALIEFVYYAHYSGVEPEDSYGALVVTSDQPTKWVPLGRASKLHPLVRRFQGAMNGSTDARAVSLYEATEEPVAEILEAVHEELWVPIEAALPPGTEQVILSPDAAINSLSFAVLRDQKKQFLGEKYLFSYVSSGRDLLSEIPVTKSQEAMVVANPIFSNPPDSEAVFQPLPGTADEGSKLAGLFAGKNISCKLLMGEEANEEKVRSVHSPRIAHFATHGYFAEEDFENLVGPMRRGGLALCGAEQTLLNWVQNKVEPQDSDGILTPLEVSSMDYQGTWLVTLSACDSGVGTIRIGEGVMGLRRGFLQAGAINLLLSLWPVQDEQTPQFMAEFYERVLDGDSPRMALARTQAEWLTRFRKEGQIGVGARLVGPFLVNFRGRPL